MLFIDDGETRRDCVSPSDDTISTVDERCWSRAIEMEIDAKDGMTAKVGRGSSARRWVRGRECSAAVTFRVVTRRLDVTRHRSIARSCASSSSR